MSIASLIVEGIGPDGSVPYVLTGGLGPFDPAAVAGLDGGWGHLTKKQRAKLKREAEAQRQRVIDGWDASLHEQAELRGQIMRGLQPEVLGVALPAVTGDYDDEEEIEMLLMAA